MTGQETASTSLVPTIETVADQRWCSRRVGRYFRSLEVPSRVFRSGCGAYQCEVCGPIKVKQFAWGAAWALDQQKHRRHITLTQAPEDWQACRQKVKDLAWELRKRGKQVQWSWTVEENPQGTGLHIHAVQHGSFVQQATLQDLWGHIAYVQYIKGTARGVAAYGAKGALSTALYGAKGVGEDYLGGLERNGGRWFHTSRGFFPPGGAAAAVKAAKAERRRAGGDTWVPLAPDAVAWHLALADLPIEEQVRQVKGWSALRSVPA